MKKRFLFLVLVAFLANVSVHAQENTHLKKLTDGVMKIRKSKSSKEALNTVIVDWSAKNNPKLTLMDELKRDDEHEFRGKDANKFKINQVVTYVYSRQNTGMVSKGDYFNSTEKDVYYSAIEKNVKGGNTVTYTLMGHVGNQEFVFVSYNPKTKFTAKINGKEATDKGNGLQVLKLGKVTPQEKIIISISNESKSNESFVILNHNPQK